MTTDQAVDETLEPEIAQETLVLPGQFGPIPVPDIVMIDGLRQQVSVLNDEVVRLRIDLDFKNRLVNELQQILAGRHSHDEHTHVHEEFDH